MFLEHIAQLGFIQHNPESAVFLNFPANTRKVVALKVCDDLLKKTPSPEKLKTSAQVRVMMECVGQAFGLPIDVQTIMIIEKASKLYRGWLLDKSSRPPPIEEDEQIFFKEIFKHYSLLFLPRSKDAQSAATGAAGSSGPSAGSSEGSQAAMQMLGSSPGSSSSDVLMHSGGEKQELRKHGASCHSLLDIYQEVGRKLSDRMTKDTWEFLLKIVLGITDSLLRLPEGESYLADDLAPKLLEVLLELFLSSRTDNNLMWDHLKHLLCGWRHRITVIHQWSATAYGLTQNVLGLLYGPEAGAEHVQVVLPHLATTEIRGLSKEYVYYAWYRVLHLLGDLETIPNAENYLEAMHGVSRLATSFVNVGKVEWADRLNAAAAPDGNTILHVVGPWLFESINQYQSGYDRGKASSLESLCTIFTNNVTTEFNLAYRSCFYCGVEEAFRTRSNLLLSVILTKMTNFFQCEFDGSHILLPSFVEAMERVLLEHGDRKKTLEGISCTMTELRRACIKIIGCMIGFGNHFRGISFQSSGKLSSYKSLGKHLGNLLAVALKEEKDETNQQLILWTSTVFVTEGIDSSTKFTMKFITTLLANLQSPDKPWGTTVSVTALAILNDLNFFDGFLTAKKSNFGKMVVSQLCNYIERKMNRHRSNQEPAEDLIVDALFAAMRWVMAGQWIVRDSNTLQQVLSVIEIGLTGKVEEHSAINDYYPPTEKIREAADLVFTTIFFHNGQFPTASGDPSFTSSLGTEHDVVRDNQLSLEFPIQNFIYDNTFVSLVPHPRVDRVCTTIVVRNTAGRFLWHAELNYFPHPILEPPELPAPTEGKPYPKYVTKSPKSPFPVSAMGEEGFSSQLDEFMDAEAKLMYESLVAEAKARDKAEQDHLSAKPGRSSSSTASSSADGSSPLPCAAQRPMTKPGLEKIPVGSRLLLTHLGLASAENHNNFCPIELGDTESEKAFKTLDNQNSRQCYAIGVVYVPKSHGNLVDDDIFNYEDGSEAYQAFLSSMGWTVEVAEHKGFTGGLSGRKYGTHAPYYADCNTEVIFRVSTMMPNIPSSSHQTHKRKFVTSSKVIITWSEQFFDATPPSVRNAFANIVVHPLPSGLFRIRIFLPETTAVAIHGPLLDDMIVSKHILGTSVRQTAVNYSKMFGGHVGKPISLRNFLIHDLVKSLKPSQALSKFLSSLF